MVQQVCCCSQRDLAKGYHKFYSYFSNGDNTHFYNTIIKYIKKGVLYPLSYYDGDWYGKDKVNSRFGCIWHGSSKKLFSMKMSLLKIRFISHTRQMQIDL